jgi:sugar phosphate isomerase/epimerase
MATPHVSRRRFLVQAAAVPAAGWLTAQTAPGPAQAAGAAKAAGWQIGIFTRPWGQWEYRLAFDAIAEAGFKYAGLMTAKGPGGLVLSMDTPLDEAHQIGAEAKKRGLKIANVYGGGFPLESTEKGIRGLRRLIDNTAAVGCPSLMMAGVADPQQQVPYYKIIAACCDYAVEKGIGSITVKPHGGLNGTGPQCRKCVELVGHKNFGLWYDPGNIFYYSAGKLDPVDDAATVDGIVQGMSVKDYRHPQRVDVTPGTGQVNFPAVMARLKKGGFIAGPLVIECLAPGDLKATLAEAKKARKFVEKLVASPDRTPGS